MTSMRGVGLAYALTPDRDPDLDPHLATWTSLARHLLLAEAFNARVGVEQPPLG